MTDTDEMIQERDNPDFPGTQDPISQAARELMGVGYLYPYQRLVVSNILEAAEAKGIGIQLKGKALFTQRETQFDQEEEDPGAKGRQIIILPTGAGKSLCFQLPALLMDRPTLVIYPILSLMADQERRLTERGCIPVVLRGGQDREERKRIWQRLDSGSCRFIIANPEVLQTEQCRSKLKDARIAHVVLDEAHCVSEWGESFRPAYLRIRELLECTAAPLVTAFTATASPPVLEKIRSHIFGTEGAHSIIGNPDRPNIAYYTRGAILPDLAVRDLIRVLPRPALVFCASRNRTEAVARYLRRELGENEIRFYHAGLEREEKKAIEQWFFSSTTGILTATCAYGLGVDKADIRTVIHRDCPSSVEAYLQESGRAGRDGENSQAVLLWGPEDIKKAHAMMKGPEGDRYSSLLAYARDAGICRRVSLLKLLGALGEACPPGPASCDVCQGKAETEYREAQSLRTFIAGNKRRYTLKEAARIAGEQERLGWTEQDALATLTQLISQGDLRISRSPLWKGRLNIAPG